MTHTNALLNTFFSTVAAYVEFFIGLLISIILARQLGSENYGTYGYYMWLITLLIFVVNGGVSLTAIKLIAESRVVDDAPDLLSIYRYLAIKQVKSLLIVCALLWIAYLFFGQLNTDKNIIYYLFISFIFRTLYMFNVAILKGCDDFKGIALIITPTSFINISLVMLLTFYGKTNLNNFIMVYCVSSTIYFILSCYFLYFKLINRKISSLNDSFKAKISEQVRKSNWTSIFTFIVMRQSEIFFLNLYSTKSNVAYFNIAFTLAFAVSTLVPGVYSNILLPLIARENKNSNTHAKTKLKQSMRYMGYLNTLLLFPILYFSDEIVFILYGKDFESVALPFQFVVLCTCLNKMVDCVNAYLLSNNKQSLQLNITIASSLVTIILDNFLIKYYGLSGALLAFSLSTLFTAFVYLCYLLYSLKLSLDWRMYFRTFFAGALAFSLIYPFNKLNHDLLSLFVLSFSYVLFYLILLFFMKALTKQEINGLKSNIRAFLKT